MPRREKEAAVLQQETNQDKSRGRLLKSVEEDRIGETIAPDEDPLEWVGGYINYFQWSRWTFCFL